MKKKRFYNNKKRNQKWTEQEKGRKISFADKYIEAGTGSDKFDNRRPKQKKKVFTREKALNFFKRLIAAVACFAVVCVGYTIMDLYIERNAMPIEDNGAVDEAGLSNVSLKLKGLNVDPLSLDGGVMLEAIVNDIGSKGYSSVSFDLKRDDGTIGYESKLATISVYGAISSASGDLEGSVSRLIENDIMPIARISCYKDSIAPVADLSSAVIINKSVYRDENKSAYLNPNSKGTYNYLKGIIEEARGMGITVFVLDNLTLPEEIGGEYSQGFDALTKKLYVDFGDNIKFIEAKHIEIINEKPEDIIKELEEKITADDDKIYYITTYEEEIVKQFLDEKNNINYALTVEEKLPEDEDTTAEDSFDADDETQENIDVSQ